MCWSSICAEYGNILVQTKLCVIEADLVSLDIENEFRNLSVTASSLISRHFACYGTVRQ